MYQSESNKKTNKQISSEGTDYKGIGRVRREEKEGVRISGDQEVADVPGAVLSPQILFSPHSDSLRYILFLYPFDPEDHKAQKGQVDCQCPLSPSGESQDLI